MGRIFYQRSDCQALSRPSLSKATGNPSPINWRFRLIGDSQKTPSSQMMLRSSYKSHGLSCCRWLCCSCSCNVQVIDEQKLTNRKGSSVFHWLIFRLKIKRYVHSLQHQSGKLSCNHRRSIIGDTIIQQVNLERVLI